ncbi:hypothetical protein ACQY0O_002371 [Thecaphora frezii]
MAPTARPRLASSAKRRSSSIAYHPYNDVVQAFIRRARSERREARQTTGALGRELRLSLSRPSQWRDADCAKSDVEADPTEWLLDLDDGLIRQRRQVCYRYNLDLHCSPLRCFRRHLCIRCLNEHPLRYCEEQKTLDAEAGSADDGPLLSMDRKPLPYDTSFTSCSHSSSSSSADTSVDTSLDSSDADMAPKA